MQIPRCIMQTQNLEANQGELIALERQYWQAIKQGDLPAALRLTGFPCVVSGPQGVSTVDQATYESMMKKSTYRIDRFDLSELNVQFPARDVAIVAYRLDQSMTVEDEKLAMECACSSTWVRQGGEWKCVQHSEAIIGDPFGRDREGAPQVH